MHFTKTRARTCASQNPSSSVQKQQRWLPPIQFSSAGAQHPLSCAGNLKAVYQYAQRIADGFRQPLPESWPAPLRMLISDCWAQRSSERPTFAQVLDRLRAIQVGA